jgi:predicted nucleic acid-binding protein
MTQKNLKVFLDTSVIFAAVLSKTGGARKMFHLGEAGTLHLVVGQAVLREADEVVRRKMPASLPLLAHLLSIGRVETSMPPTQEQLQQARAYVQYVPDAHVLAEALQANPDWFVTHDKEHFLNLECEVELPFRIGTPGDLLQAFKDRFIVQE